jgi:ribosomal protein L11 methyltransferase
VTQPAPVWRFAIDLPDQSCVAAFDEAMTMDESVVTAQEIDDGPCWRLICHCAVPPDRTALEARLAVVAASNGIDPPLLAIEEMPAIDWVAEYQSRIQPLTIGGFFIFPSHFTGDVPDGLAGIKLDASNAFGTGEHESTAGCLLALEDLKAQGLAIERALDLGCGSAILAIAMARLWPDAAILAVDNDPDAVNTAAENVSDNGCADTVSVAVSDGYGSERVQAGVPYPLIVANILARPLIAMAPDAVSALAVGGYAILSGILSEQAAMVQDAYESVGFAPVNRLEIGKWTTLVLRRPR